MWFVREMLLCELLGIQTMLTKTQIAVERTSYPGATSNSVAFCAMCEAAFCICGPKPRLEQNLDYNIKNQIINVL